MDALLEEIKKCRLCALDLPFGANPVMAAHPSAKIMIVGQAPGRVVHQTGIPWNDKSGDNLRQWLGITKEIFYDSTQIALVPMGFCYPGTGKSGDLPPRKECAPLWHQAILEKMPEIELTLLVGNYAQYYYLGKKAKANLTENVRNFENFFPNYFPLPHPSPRNNLWMGKNKWFEENVLPILRLEVQRILFDINY